MAIRIVEVYKNVRWVLEPVSVAGSKVTLRAIDRQIPMAASLLDFSLWTAKCTTLEWALSEESIEALKPWLRSKGFYWKIGWKRKPSKPRALRTTKSDPRQLRLFK